MKLHKFMKNTFLGLLTMGAMFALTVTAHAADIGSGNGGGPTIDASTAWREIVGKPNTSQAWNKFLAIKGVWDVSEGYFAREIVDPMGLKGSPERLSNICRRSEVIYYYSYPNSSIWSTKGTSTNRAQWIYTTDNGGTTTNVKNRSAITKHYWREFKNNDKEWRNWNGGQVVLICTGHLPAYQPLKEVDRGLEYDSKIEKTEETISGDISYYLKATPVRRQDYNSYSSAKKAEWNSKHKVQQSPTVKTEFGKFLDANPWSKVKTESDWKAWKKGAQAAINKGKSNPSITFNKSIMSALKDGGIYTIMESGQNETFTAPFTQKKVRHRTITDIVDTSTGEVVRTKKGPWSEWENEGGKVLESTKRNPQPITPKYYQILTVKCNLEEYQAALKASGGSKLATANGEAMGGIVTKATTNPNSLPFGNPNHSNAALRKTAYDRFYNQITSCESNFVCHVDKQDDAANGSGFNLTSENGAATVRVDGKSERGNAFTFFRDNEGGPGRTIMPNVWYPKDKGSPDMKIDSKAPAKKTKIAFNNDGTPKLGTVKVNIKNPNGGNMGEIAGSGNVNGHIARLEFRSDWASEANKPTRVHLDWIYEGGLQSKLPTVVNGAGVVSASDFSSPIFVGCKMNNDATRPQKAEVTLNESEAYKRTEFDKSRSHIQVLFNRAVSADSKQD